MKTSSGKTGESRAVFHGAILYLTLAVEGLALN